MERQKDGSGSDQEETPESGRSMQDREEEIRVRSRMRPLIDDRDGLVILGRSESAHRRWRRKATLDIGAVGEHQDEGEDLFSKRVLIDAAFPHIIFICGKRGSGKSYTLGLFAEELARSCIGVGVVLVDPIGIFWSLKKENESASEREKLREWGLSPHSFPEVRVLVPGKPESLALGAADGPFTIGVGEMTAEDWCQIFDMERFKTQGLLVGAAIDMVRTGYKAMREGRIVNISGKSDRYSLGDLVNCIRSSATLTSKEGGFTPQTRRSLIARFNAAGSWGIFSLDGTPLSDVTSPNRVTVIDISDPNLGDDKRSLITGVLARKILSARIYSARQEEHEGYDETDPDHIPVTWMMIDEAHVILPHNRQTPATDALVEYAKQGRRPGCALILATQRPASTSDEILSQVDILIGHNLALEDDMSALRRRVPAKLPPEFANSDFIRAIPVGTAIVADQRTQQRAFLMKLRPRMSHHAGSSAMPSALSDRPQRKAAMPMSATRSTFEDPSSIMRPTDGFILDEERSEGSVDQDPWVETVAEEAGGPTVKEERPTSTNPLGSVQNGNTVLVVAENPSLMVINAHQQWGDRRYILISRTHPSRYPDISMLDMEKSFWLSSTPSEISAAPNDIQDLLMDIGRLLETSENKIIIFDGFDTLFVENEHRSVIRFLQVLREKVFLGGHVMIVRADGSLPAHIRESISREMDASIEIPLKVKETAAIVQEQLEGPKDELPAIEESSSKAMADVGSLSAEELREMCRMMGIPETGDEKEMLERIIRSGEKEGLIRGEGSRRDMYGMIAEVSRMSRENIELRRKISEMEDKVKDASKGSDRKKDFKAEGKKRKIQVVWEDDGRTSMEDMRSAMASLTKELEGLKTQLHKREKDASQMQDRRSEADEALKVYIQAFEAQRLDSMKRITELEGILRDAMVRLERREKGPVGPPSPGKEKAAPAAHSPHVKEIGQDPSDVIQARKKLKVLKQKDSCVMIPGRVEPEQAALRVKRTLKRTLFRGPLERIIEIVPAYLPLFRCLVTYRTGILKKLRTGDIFIDPITSEEVRSSSSGMRRSKGIPLVIALTPMERKCYQALSATAMDDARIAMRSGLTRPQVKRALNSMEKKGLIEKRMLEGRTFQYRTSRNLQIDPEPWKRSEDWVPETVECIGERILRSEMDERTARSITATIWSGIKLMEVDVVHYPLYIAKIEGEGRVRYCVVDAVTGTVDEELTSRSKGLI